MKRILFTTGMVVLAAALVGCGGGKRTLNLMGSTSVQPFAGEVAQAYEQKHPDLRVNVEGGGSTAGIEAVRNGLAQIGTCSRDLKPEEAAEFTPIVIARDGIAVIVHPSNPVTGLTKEQIRRVFAGAIANWKDVGGPDLVVRPITREESSGTRETFMHLIMDKDRVVGTAIVQESNGTVRELVKNDPAAVGYISMDLINESVKALDVDGVTPTAQAVISGEYKLARPFLFVVRGTPSPDAQAFIDFVLSDEGQKVLTDAGLIGAK